jgi:CRP/FNR family transcriptional regulator, cyclic AMP receptor protein
MEWPFKKALKETIKSNRVFKGVTDAQIKAIMAHGTRKKFIQNELILRESQETGSLFLVVEGILEVKLENPATNMAPRRIADVKLNSLEPGDCFGEYSLIDRQLVSATVQAKTNGILFAISESGFKAITGSDDRLACLVYKNLLEVLVGRLRKKDRELDEVLILR